MTITRKLLEEALGVLESEYEGTDAHQDLISNIRIYLTGVDRESCTHKFTHEVVAGDPVWCVNCGLEKTLD